MKHPRGISVLVVLLMLCAGPASAAPVTYVVDGQASSVTFETSMMERIIGNAMDISGTVSVDPAAPGADASGRVRIATHSLKSDNEKRDQHMHERALESEKYPQIIVTTTGVTPVGSAPEAGTPAELEVAATLELHGQSLPITFHARMEEHDGALTIDGTTNLLMTDYGITPPRLLFLKVRDLTEIRFHIVARPDSP